MSEKKPFGNGWYQDLESHLERNVQYFNETDPANLTLGYFAKAALIALRDQDSGLRSVVDHMRELRGDIDPPHAVKLLERGYQADLLQHDQTYPLGYQTEEAWLNAFYDVSVHHDLLRWGVVANNVTLRPLQSNISERYKTIKLLAAVTAHRFNGPVSHLDIGSSVMHGDYRLLQEHNPNSPVRPFRDIEIVRRDDTETPDERMTALANVALKQQVTFGPVMGVDITDINDESVRRWAKSCSFYPDELFKPEEVDEYDLLDQIGPEDERTYFYQGDFATLDRKKFAQASPVEEWDIITFSTLFYQVTKQERLAMLINASNLLSENGLIVIQDARDGNFSKPFNYTTSVIDAASANNRHEEFVLVWDNGRCHQAYLGNGKLTMDGTPVPLGEALEDRFGSMV